MKNILHYAFYCHRLPDRSFVIGGRQLPVCSRCTGILLGYIGGFALLFSRTYVALPMLLLLAAPLIVDGFGQHYKRWRSTNPRRFFTGIGFGVSLVLLARELVVSGYSQGRILGQLLRQFLV